MNKHLSNEKVIGVPLDTVIEQSIQTCDRPLAGTELIHQSNRLANYITLKVLLGPHTLCLSDSHTELSALSSQATYVRELLRTETTPLTLRESTRLIADLITIARLKCSQCLTENCDRRGQQ